MRLDALPAQRTLSLTERVDIALVNLSVLKSGRARAATFSTLVALCQTLGCQRGELIAYVPDVEP